MHRGRACSDRASATRSVAGPGHLAKIGGRSAPALRGGRHSPIVDGTHQGETHPSRRGRPDLGTDHRLADRRLAASGLEAPEPPFLPQRRPNGVGASAVELTSVRLPAVETVLRTSVVSTMSADDRQPPAPRAPWRRDGVFDVTAHCVSHTQARRRSSSVSAPPRCLALGTTRQAGTWQRPGAAAGSAALSGLSDAGRCSTGLTTPVRHPPPWCPSSTWNGPKRV